MASPAEQQKSFRLYVTHVDGDGHFLKISGQLDQQSSMMVESMFESARENLDTGIGAVPPANIYEGMICAVKYKDGMYYRAKIINTTNLSAGLVGVHFIDYGNKDVISISAIRFLDVYDTMFLQLRGQATDYYLTRIMHPSGRWNEPFLLKLQRLLCYAEFPVAIEGQSRTLPIISLEYQGCDMTTHLVSRRFGKAVPVAIQEVMMMQPTESESLGLNWAPSLLSDSSLYAKHVPFLANRGSPANPASAMSFHSESVLFNATVPPPSNVKAFRNPVNCTGPIRQPQVALNSPPDRAATPSPAEPLQQPAYKSRLLDVNSEVKVYVSFTEEGPELFAVQLVMDAKPLQDMTNDINRRPHSSLVEPPMIGTVCLGRMSGNKIICRSIVVDVSGSQCKLFFVDFGDTELVSYYDIYDIPKEFVKPNVFAMRFCLSGVQILEKGPCLNKAFKQLVTGKVMTLRVVPPEGPPLIQYGELYSGNENVLDLLLANGKDKLQFKRMKLLPVGSRAAVQVSNVDSCVKFYVQLSDKSSDLTALMEAVKTHCESTSSPGRLPVGAACCARFPDDGKWYRAKVLKSDTRGVRVAYVDYGNEQKVDVLGLRTITSELMKLPTQALKCALEGFDRPVDSETARLKTLVLEKTLTAHILGVVSRDSMLVSLVDETTVPPLDVGRECAKTKRTARVSKAPEQLSAPEAEHGEGFKREKSSTEERRRSDDFQNRRGKPREGIAAAASGEAREAPPRPPYRGRADRGSSVSKLNKRDESEETTDRNSRFRRQDSGERRDCDQRRGLRGERGDFSSTSDRRFKQLPDPAPLETPFPPPQIEGAHEVSVAWGTSPKCFFLRVLSLQPQFHEMMQRIPELYEGVLSYRGTVCVGASVLARSPSDGVLYRATVVAVRPPFKFIVQYVDFGNKERVDLRDIWQLDRQLLQVPRMAIHSMIDVKPVDGEWKAHPEIDKCFNSPRYQCVFQGVVDDCHVVQLFNDGVSVADILVEKKLALPADDPSLGAVEGLVAMALNDDAINNLASLHLDGVDLSGKLVEEKLATPQVTETAAETVETAAETVETAAGTVETAAGTVETAAETVETAAETVETAAGTVETAAETVETAAETVETAAETVETAAETVETVEPVSLPSGCSQVYISHFDSPGQFWLQMADKVDKIEEIQAELAADADNYQDFKREGSLYVAKHSADDLWYRAELLDQDLDVTTIRFIDYGHTDILWPGQLKVMPEKLRAIEPLAVRSSVNAVPSAGRWSEAARKSFEMLIGDAALTAAVVLLKDKVTYVDLFVDGRNVTDQLVAQGHATREQPTDCGDPPSRVRSPTPRVSHEPAAETAPAGTAPVIPQIYISHVDSPGHFWRHVDSPPSEFLPAMGAASEDAENVTELASLEEGVLRQFQQLPDEPAKEPAKCCPLSDADGADGNTRDILNECMDNDSTLVGDNENELDTEIEHQDQHEELDSSDLYLDGSLDSTHTVIENKSFAPSSSRDHNEQLDSPKQDTSPSTLFSSSGTIKTPERDTSKGSITDTGYTGSDGTSGSPENVMAETTESGNYKVEMIMEEVETTETELNVKSNDVNKVETEVTVD